jgi:hypothetical protein
MTFEAREVSRQLGQPVNLYYFRYGEDPDSYYAYTDAEEQIEVDGISAAATFKRSIYVVISTSMNATALNTAKDSVIALLDEIDTKILAGRPIDVGVAAVSSLGVTTSEFIDASTGNIVTLKAFVAALTDGGDPDYSTCAEQIEAWFTGTVGDAAITRRIGVMVGAGEAASESDSRAAEVVLEEVYDRYTPEGAFTVEAGTSVDLFAVSLADPETKHLAVFDNTPEDGGVPVVPETEITLLSRHLSAWVFPEVVFAPVPASRGAITVQGDLDKSAMEIELSVETEIATLYKFSNPGRPVMVMIRQGHLTDEDLHFPVVYVGRIINVARRGKRAVLSCESVATSMRRTGLRRTYQYGCPHVLYSQGNFMCNADKTAAQHAGIVSAISGATITLTAGWNGSNAANKFNNGLVEWNDAEGNRQYRAIYRVDSNVLTLNAPVYDVEVTDTVQVYLGCNHQRSDCTDLHVTTGTSDPNTPNYGGQPWIPFENPIGFKNMYN